MEIKSKKSFDEICEELGLRSQFLLELSQRASSLYTTYDLPKRSGGVRTISVPNKILKAVQRSILQIIFCRFHMPEHIHGCVKGRSIVTNAKGHTNQTLVVNIDLKNFFGTIKYSQVLEVFKETFSFDDECAEIFTRLTTYGNCLPQGAPTSPTLANIIALSLDQNLLKVCEDSLLPQTYHYSRYIDDITISGGRELDQLIKSFYQAIHQCGFKANPKKLKISRQSDRQKVTGIIVNKKLNPPRKLIRKIRQQVYYSKKFGIAAHCNKVNVDPIVFQQKIYGELGLLGMTRPDVQAEFSLDLHDAKSAYYPNSNSEEERLLLLKDAIDNELKVEFKYFQEIIYTVVPVEIVLNEFDYKCLRGFELKPEQTWKTYWVKDMEDLRAF